MANVRSTILDDLVLGLDKVEGVAKATEYMLSLDNAEKWAPIISVVVESEEPVLPGSNRYRAELGLYVLTDQTRTGIEDLIEDIKEYIRTASITNVLELLYIGHEDVPKEDSEEGRYSSVKILLSLLYKDTNTDTLANAHYDSTITGYMAGAHYKIYALMVSGSTTFQPLGTNVYDSHKSANIEIPANSGSISVDIVNSAIVEDDGGIYNNLLVDDNDVIMSIRGHYPIETPNRTIEPFMYTIVNEIRSNVNLGDSYKLLANEPFDIAYNQVFDESGTTGSELIFSVRRYWSY